MSIARADDKVSGKGKDLPRVKPICLSSERLSFVEIYFI
jgi:hypothetical protein